MKKNDKNELKISFVGDIMSKMQQNKLCLKDDGKYDFEDMFKKIKYELQECDYLIGNLETPIAGIENKYTYIPFSFNTPSSFLSALKTIGVDLVSTANNHCLDRGFEGLNNTIDNLDNYGIKHTGTFKTEEDRNTILIEKIEGIKFAFISYTYGTNAHINKEYLNENNYFKVNLLRKQEKNKKNNLIKRIYLKIKKLFNWNDQTLFLYYKDKKYLKRLQRDIEKAKNESDYVIFCMHSGGQYNKKEDRYTKGIAKFAIKKGVDYVVGCHPHVVHGSKLLKENKFIAYSLGNFCSTPFTNSKQKNDLPDYTIMLNLYFDKATKKLTKITFNILKSILDKNNFTYLDFADKFWEKIENSEEKERVKRDIIKIANIFSNNKIEKITHEYKIL